MKLKNLRSKQRMNARRKDWRVCRVPPGHCEIIGVGVGMIRFRVRPRGDMIGPGVEMVEVLQTKGTQ